MSSSDDSDQYDFLNELKSIRKAIDWEVMKERRLLFDRFRFLIRHWKGQLPNLRDIFQAKEIDWILSESVESGKELLIEFVVKCGYKDEPEVGQEGKPSPRCTTPVHRVGLEDDYFCVKAVSNLFKIYNRFDVNYTDASGLTHFHVACKFGCEDVVEKFLIAGQDPNQLVPETGDSMLHLALAGGRMEVVKLLLNHGANPNSMNKDEKTPLHSICNQLVSPCYDDLVETFFKMCDEKHKTVQIDAKDKLGDTPLLLAVIHAKVTEVLLRRGADPNLANEEGLTPLHYISKFQNNGGIAESFFKVIDDIQQTVQVDALDNEGLTPLQWAVARFLPHVVDLLLDHGADLSRFVFPTENYYGDCFDSLSLYSKLGLASECLTVVERLEKRGYKLDRIGALTIVKFFVEHKLFAESANLEKSWYDDKKVIRKTKEIKIIPSLSLFNVICLSPEEAAKQLIYTDYYKFAKEVSYFEILPKSHRDACVLHLCEKVSRKFFICWALKSFSKLTRYRLPIECCRMIIEPFLNKDLCNITLATKG